MHVSETCALCGGPVNPYDSSTWKEVVGFVGGPRKDSMRLRRDTGRYAHNHCVGVANAGQQPDTVDLLTEIDPVSEHTPGVEELFDDD